MAQITTGIKSILSISFFYDLLQNIMGAKTTRKYFIDKIVKPNQDSRVLDIGCGTSDILKYLPIGTEYIGIDPNSNYIASAKKNFPKRGEFFVGYYNEEMAKNLDKFDIVICHGVLHHLEDNEIEHLLSLIFLSLKENGKFCTLDCAYSQGQNKIARFLIDQDRGKNVRSLEEYKNLTQQVFPKVKAHIYHRKFIPYTYCFMECFKTNDQS